MKMKLKSILAAALCAVGLTASALPPSPYRDIWSSTPDPQAIKDPANVIDWGMSSRTFESFEAKHGKFLAASADEMIAAYTARIEKDPTDCEALICRAFAYAKKAGENEAFDRLAKEFGYTFDNDTMHFTGELIQKKGVTPEMNDVSAEVCDILLPLMKAAYDDLCAVPKNWKGEVAITPDVYPVDEEIFFDWADVLCAKLGLAEMMCVLNMVKGFDVTMDSDLLEYTFNSRSPKNGKRGVQPILENNPDFFSKVRDQKAATEAGDWWASAATLLDQWDKAQAKRSDGKQHFFDWNFEKVDHKAVTSITWLRTHRDGLINLPYWASSFDYTLMNGDKNQFWTLQPLFAGKFLREHFPDFGVGVKEPWCNEPLLDTLPDSTLCGIYPGVSRTYIGNLMTEVARAGDFTTIPPYTPDGASTVHAIWYTNMFELGFANTGNPAIFAWDTASPITLLDPEFNVRGVTAVFKGWSFSGYPSGSGSKPETWEGSEIPTPFPKEHAFYKRRNVVATANFEVPQVTYLDFEAGELSERTDECELVKADTTTFEAGKVYAVVNDVTLKHITVNGTTESPAKLVLCDGVTLAVTNGVEVAAGKALVICGQALGTGTLEATSSTGAAGIGSGGIVTINGGTVMAAGGSSGAGIGGGTVTINGGTVTATGNGGAAGIAGTVKFADGIAYGVAAGADEANALYKTAAAFTADPSAAYVALPYFSLKIPEAKAGYSYEVSSMGVQPKAALADQTNTYAIATGATARVLFTPGADYVWEKEPEENPMILTNISEDTVIDEADLPTTKFMKKGSAGNPWAVGYSTRDSVAAWTNGTDKLVVEGAGNMDDFTEGNPAPWGTGISEVEIGEDVTSIGARAFADSQLGSVTIPASVTSIGAAAFFGSTSLSNVVVEAMMPSALGAGAFEELAEGFKIVVPIGTSAVYKAAPGWSLYADSIVEGEPGSPGNPWTVGTPKAADVVAYTNVVGKLVVEGEGNMRGFDPPSDSAPWGRDITSVKIGEDVTGIGAKAFADSTSLSNVTIKAMTPPVLGAHALTNLAENLTIYVPYGTSEDYKAAPGWSDFADSIVELPEPIAAESDEFAVDLRPRVEFEKGKTRIDVVTWSATAWGAVPGSKYTDLGFRNKTTGATGVIAEGLVGENLDDCPLPEKDGEYLLTHTTGDLKSFVTFVVSGYPIGGETNPWTVGPADDPDGVVAWTDGNGNVYFKPPRRAVSRTGLETITNAMGGASFPAWLVDADRSATNVLVMVVGGSGVRYDSIKAALEAGEGSCSLYDVEGCVVGYDGMGAAGEMKPDMFIPGVPTNLTANAYTAVGYTFQGWTTNGAAGIVFKDKAEIDDPQAGDVYDLKAVWKSVPVTATTYLQLASALAVAAEQGAEMPVTINVSGTIDIPDGGEAEVSGDPAKAKVTLKGSGTINGCVVDGGNLMVGGSVKIDYVRLAENAVIGIDPANPLRSGAKIRVVTEETVTFGNPVKIAVGAKKGDEKYFVSDDSYATYEDGAIVFHQKGDVNIPWEIGKDVKAYIDEAGTLHIKGTGAMKDFTETDPAPWAAYALDIKAIQVEAGVTKVGSAAFDGFDFVMTTKTLTFQDEDHVLNLLAFVSADGSKTNAPSVSAFGVYVDSTGKIEPVETFMTQDGMKMSTMISQLMRSGYDEALMMMLAGFKAAEKAKLIEAAGETPYSKTMQGLLDEALAKLDAAENYRDVDDVDVTYADQIEQQAKMDESHEIKGEGYDITWRFMDGELVLTGEGEMPDFTAEGGFTNGAPWNVMKDDITNVTVAAGITFGGDASFAVCPAFAESSVLFKDPEIELNLGAFVSGDKSVTNVPTVKVEIVTVDEKGEHKLRVVPGGWTEGTNTYETIAAAIAAGAESVTAAFEKKTDEGEKVVPPAEAEEVVKTVVDEDGNEIDLTARYTNNPNDVENPAGLVTEIENLSRIVIDTSSNIVITVTATNKMDKMVTKEGADVVKEMDGAMSNDCEIVKAALAPDVETKNFDSSYLDMSAFWSFKATSGQLVEFTKSIIAHIPMKLYDGQIYSVSRRHEGVTEVLPMWTEETVDSDTAEWVKVDVANQELVVKTRRFCDYALGELELEKTCTVYVKNGSKTLGEADPSSLATNVEIVVTGPVNASDFAGYAKRAAGEAIGEYPINYVMAKKMPADFPAGKYTVHPGVFEIVMGEKLSAEGTVKYPSTYKVSGYDTGLLREKASASWTATAAKGSVFAGWVVTNDAPECVTNHIAVLSENERRKSPLSFKVAEGEQIRPTDIAAIWARIDEDTIDGVSLVTNAAGMLARLDVKTLSYVTASVSGLPSWYSFDSKTLKVTEKTNVTRRDAKTSTVKVSVKNASGYTWKQDFSVVFAAGTGAVLSITPVADEDAHGVSLMVRCDPAMGTANGTGVYTLTLDKKTGIWSKNVSISASAKSGYAFAGWYTDPGFTEPAEFWTGSGTSRKPKDYRETSQTVTLTEPTYLFARFVEKTSKADPITWLRYSTAAYAKGETSLLAPEDADVWMQGVTLPATGCAIAFGSASKPTVSVSGLPSGTRYDSTYRRFTGIPTRVGTNTVKITVKNVSGATDVLTRRIVVLPLPAWAVGNFGGVVADAAETTHGTAQMTVSSVGKVSGKFAQSGTNWTYSASAYADWIVKDGETFFSVVATSKYSKVERVLKLTVAAEAPRAEDYRINETVAEGTFGVDNVDLRRIVWKDAGAKALLGEYAGAYDYWTLDGTKYTLKLATDGKATIAGKTAQGRSISLSADALTDLGTEDAGCYAMRLVAPFYAAPARIYSSAQRAYVQTPEFFEFPEFCNVSATVPVPGEIAIRQVGAIMAVDRTVDGFGYVSVSPTYGQVASGKTLTFTTSADKNSTFVRWVVTDADGNPVDLGGDEYAKTLKLVADGRDVKVQAVFADKYAPPVVPTIDAEGLAYVLTNLFVGVKVDYLVQIPEAARPVTFSAKNLPTGLKIDSVTGRITGVPTKAGVWDEKKAVTITATGTHAVKPKDAVTCAAEVQALAAWAQGSFDGSFIDVDVEVAPGVTNRYTGLTVFTIGTTGKISGTAKTDLGNITFSAASFDRVDQDGVTPVAYWVDLEGSLTYNRKTVKVPFSANVKISGTTGLGVIGYNGDRDCAVQNPWKSRKELGYPSFPTGSAALSLTDGELVLKFGSNGAVTISGKVPGDNGTLVSVSGSSQVQPAIWNGNVMTAYVEVFVAPKTNLAKGFFKEYTVELTSDGTTFTFAKDVTK